MTGKPPAPVRPTNVRIERAGQLIPVELAYVGVEDGLHVWESITPIHPGTDQVRIDLLPARTSIRFGKRAE